MPKETRDKRSLSFDQPRPSPYPRDSKNADKSTARSLKVDDENEWTEARCPVCMEHPHKAVLLICSSHEKGCRPYMCNTNHCQSNCLDQFLKLAANESSKEQLEQVPDQSKLVCPLCRGQISKWVINEPAREFMNSKTRSCSMETCDFVGNYSEIKKHAKTEHPNGRPMEMDPTRQQDWERWERRTAFLDLYSAFETRDRSEEGGRFLEIRSSDRSRRGSWGTSLVSDYIWRMRPWGTSMFSDYSRRRRPWGMTNSHSLIGDNRRRSWTSINRFV